MKATLALLGCLTVFTSQVFAAGTDAIIKQHAKDLANQNNNRYAEPAPGQPQPPAAAGAVAIPTLSPSLAKFQTDLASLQAGTAASTDQQQKLAQELVAGAQGAKPSVTNATKLVAEISEAFAQKPLSPSYRARFVQELDAVLNPGKYPMARLDGIYASIKQMFQSNGLSDTKADQLVEDIKAISTQIQNGGVR